jgi:hypothetical protein
MARKPSADVKELEARYVNFRVSPEEFKELKIDAIAHDMTLGELMMHAYRFYKAKK